MIIQQRPVSSVVRRSNKKLFQGENPDELDVAANINQLFQTGTAIGNSTISNNSKRKEALVPFFKMKNSVSHQSDFKAPAIKVYSRAIVLQNRPDSTSTKKATLKISDDYTA